jgi:hypothetical protein
VNWKARMMLFLDDTRLRRTAAILLGAVIGLGLIFLIVLGYMGSYSRYIADDFCTAGEVSKMGFWPAQQFRYQTWSGRFAFTFTIAGSHLLGPSLTPLMPAIVIILWILASISLFFQLSLTLTDLKTVLVPTVLATLILSVVLAATPNIYQSLFWQTGLLTYSFPLMLATAYLGWLIKIAKKIDISPPTMPMLALSLIWPLFMGGFSETFVSVQTAALSLFTASSWLGIFPKSSKTLRQVLLLGFLGSLAAFILLVIAPGNAVRQGVMPPPQDSLTLIKATFNDWYIFSVRTLKWHPIAILLSVLIPFLTGYGLFILRTDRRVQDLGFNRRFFLWFLGIPILTFLLMLGSIAPYEYALSSFPDARVLITTLYICILGIASWSYLAGLWFSVRFLQVRASRLINLNILLMMSLGLHGIFIVQSTRVKLKDRDTMVRYAAAWDERDRQLRTITDAAGEPIVAASLTHMGGLAEIGYDPNEWINRCVASTYGLESVIAK